MSPDKNPPTPTIDLDAADSMATMIGRAGLWYGGPGAMHEETIDGGEVAGMIRGLVKVARSSLASEAAHIPDPAMARAGIELIKRHAPPGELTPAHITAIVDAAESAFVLARSFEVRLDADRRAVARWQAGEPNPDVKALIETGKTLRTALSDIDWSNGEDNPPFAAISALSAALDDAETGINTPAGHRGLIWPDHADLLVWLLELLDVRPPCPSPDEVDEMIRRLRAVYAASPMIHDACGMMEKLANALIASSRRTVVAETERGIIPRLIASFVRENADREQMLLIVADRIESGVWHPTRGPAIRAAQEALGFAAAAPSHPEAEEQGRQMRLVSGCEESIVGDLGRGSMEESHAGEPPRFYDSLRTALGRPDVQEAIAKALAAERGADWEAATEAGRNAFRDEAAKLLSEASNAPRG